MPRFSRKTETQNREMECWRLRAQGLPQDAIAKRLSLTQPAVSKILRRVGERLAEEFVEEARGVKMLQTAQLEHIAAEALAAWERSKADAVTEVTVKGKSTAEGEKGQAKAQITRTVTSQIGNPAYLGQARGALADVRELWGLSAPVKQEISGPGGAPVPLLSEIVVELPREREALPAAEPPALPNVAPAMPLVVELPG